MKLEKKESYRVILFAGVVLALVLNIGLIWSGAKGLVDVFSPIILGAILAFIFNVPMKAIEELLEKWQVPQGLRRSLSIVLVMILLCLIFFGVVAIVVPTLTTAVSQLGTTTNQLLVQVGDWLKTTGWLDSSQLQDLSSQISKSGLIHRAVGVLGSLTGNVTAVFSNLFSVLMSLFLMLSMLGSKEHLSQISLRLMRVSLPERWIDHLTYAGRVLVETYDKFLMGQMIEAVIIGVLVFLAYTLVGLPYAALTGVLAGVLSFIPYVGPISACGLGAVFIFTVSPVQALLSIVVFQVIQLIEGNMIYPRVVGQSVGLPALFTLAAALIGGNLFGLVGMIFFTPIFAVIYRLVREYVELKEK